MGPLDGIRIVDLSQVWSGPYSTRILGDLGADVIKVEGPNRPDPERGPMDPKAASGGPYPGNDPGDEPYNRAGRFVEYNRNKRDIAIDLKTAEGVEILKSLVAVSDVVIENFSVGVTQRLGVDYEQLRSGKPDLVMISMPAFGTFGPDSGYVAFGPQQECLVGLAAITGYDLDIPTSTGVFYPDPTVALFAVSAILTALWHREVTGEGQHIELAQREAVTFALPEPLIDLAATGKTPNPNANGHPVWSPHGCFRCIGDDTWIAVSVTSDQEWRSLLKSIGRADLLEDERFSTPETRVRNRRVAEQIVESWTSQRDPVSAMNTLQNAGMPAGVVMSMADVLDDPHYGERGFFVDVEYSAGVGKHPSLGFPWKFSDTPASVRRPTPGFAEHTAEILRDIANLDEDEIARLFDSGVVGHPRAG